MKTPKAVLFDLDDTLLDRARTFERYFSRFADRYGTQLRSCPEELLRNVIRDADGVGYRTHEEMALTLLERLPWITRPTVEQLVENYRADFLACAYRSEGIDELLGRLAARGIKTGIVTNGLGAVQRRKIDRLGLTARMDAILVSEEVGTKKPDPAIFRHALKKLQVDAGDAWFIGDHPDLDIAAAEAVGMTAFWLARMTPWPAERPACQRRIDSLSEVLRLL